MQAEPPGSPFYSWGHRRANPSMQPAHLGSEGSFRHALGPVERKALHPSRGLAASWRGRQVHQTPPPPHPPAAFRPPKTRGCPPYHSPLLHLQTEGPQTPSSRAAAATEQRQPHWPRASAECGKDSSQNVLRTVRPQRGLGRATAGGMSGSRPQGSRPLCAHWHSGGCPGQAATSPSGGGTAPQGLQGREARGGHGAHLKCPLVCPLPPIPSLE